VRDGGQVRVAGATGVLPAQYLRLEGTAALRTDAGADALAGVRYLEPGQRLELVNGPARNVTGPLRNEGIVEVERTRLTISGEFATDGAVRLLSADSLVQATSFRVEQTGDQQSGLSRQGRIEGLGTVQGPVRATVVGAVVGGLLAPPTAGTLTVDGDLTWTTQNALSVVVTGTTAESVGRVLIRGRALSQSSNSLTLNVHTTPTAGTGPLRARVVEAAGGLPPNWGGVHSYRTDTFDSGPSYELEVGPQVLTLVRQTGTPIERKHATLGGDAGFLGPGAGPETALSGGAYRLYRSGSIYWTSTHGAWEIHGGIRETWSRLGWERSALGYPVTDELGTPDGRGRFNHFERGSVYSTSTTGAREIRGTWSRLGWERSALGYPVTDELGTPDGVGRFNHFQGGSVYSTPTTGAREVRGPIRDAWASRGWERSALGYPVSDEYDVSGGRRNDFQGGALIWNASTGQVTEIRR
jgi:hypothetical protein